MRRDFLRATLCVCALIWSAGCSGSAQINFLSNPGGPPPGPGSYKDFTQCAEGDVEVAATSPQRLSKLQYEGHVIDALTGSASGLIAWSSMNAVWRQRYPVGVLATTLAQVPQDYADRTYARMDQRFSEVHLEGYFAVADQAAEYYLANSSQLSSLVSSLAGNSNCLVSSTQACVANYFQGLARRFLARPLDTDELGRYWSTFSTTWAGFSLPERYTMGLRAMLLHPEFLFVVQNRGQPVPGRPGSLKKTPHELVRELALRYEDGPPSDAVYALAQSVTDLDPDAVMAQLVRPSGNNHCLAGGTCDSTYPLSRAQFVTHRFVREYTEMDRFVGFGSDAATSAAYSFCWPSPTGCLLGNELPTSGNHNYLKSMEDEQLRLHFRNLWGSGGFAAYMRDPSYVLSSTSDYTNRIYGYSVAQTPPWGSPVTSRPGPLTRAGFMNSGSAYPNMIQLGSKMLRKFMCRPLPDPNVQALPEGFRGGFDRHSPAITTREYVAKQTESAACMGCHSVINPIGALFGGFDGIGRELATHPLHNQGRERVFSPSGTVAAYLDVDTSASVRLDGQMRQYANIQEFVQALADSEEAQVCYARQVFEFGFGRKADRADACSVKPIFDQVKNGSLKDAWMEVGRSPASVYRKVAP